MRRVVVIAIVGLAVLLAPAPAQAHALLQRSSPSGGQILQAAPSSVTIWFTEEPDPTLSSIQVLDSGGANVGTGAAQAVPGTPKALSVALKPGLPDGVYTVSWRVVSRVDGHLTNGSFSYGVGVAPPTTAGPSTGSYSAPSPAPLAVAGRTMLYAGLAVLLAAGALGAFVFHGVPGRGRTLALAWALAAVGSIAMVASERSTVGIGLGALLRSEAGRPFLRTLAAVAVCGVAALLAWKRAGTSTTLWLLAATAAAAMLVRVLGGHAAADGGAVQETWQWLHLVGVGIWVGGLPLLVVALRSGAGIAQARRFSTVAGWSLAVVAVTGVLRAAKSLGGYGRFLHVLSTSYGTALAWKSALALVLVGLGTWNRYRSLPAMERSGSSGMLRRVVTGEVVIATGILLTTGILTGLPPAAIQTPQGPTRPGQVVAVGSDFATTTRVRLTATPGAAGPNTFSVVPTNYDSGATIDASRVSLTFQPVGRPDVGASTLELAHAANAAWTARGTQLSLDGAWNITVLVQTGSNSVDAPLTLFTLPPPSTTNAQAAAGQPTIYNIKLSDGRSIQTYNDPGAAGADELHVTAFDTTGAELPISSALVIVTPPGGAPMAVPARRLDTGHFVADVQLTAGRWRFAEILAAKTGGSLYVTFDQTIGA